MQSLRATRSTVLGKRSQRTESQTTTDCQLSTPDPSPALKRPRTLSTSLDGDHNKENIPPNELPDIAALVARETRALRRTSTETSIGSPANSPPRPIAGLRRASTSLIFPTKAVAQLCISTPPSTPRRPQPIHAQARTLLRSTCSEAADVVGREDERKILGDFIATLTTSDHQTSSNSALYISGSPGCGKTALVTAVLEELSATHPNISTVVINCMTLPNVEALLDRLAENVNPTTKGSPRKGKGKRAANNTSTPCILVLDELDHIASDAQSLDKVFAAVNSNVANLRVIAIANTHTLTSQASALPIASNVATLHFAPYKDGQLLKILQARLAPLQEGPSAAAVKDFFPTPALMLLSKKVAAITGDVRTLFEVLRGAVDMAVKKAGNVTPDVILAAFKAHAPTTSRTSGGSEIISKVQNQPMQARLVLLSLVLASKRVESHLPLSSGTIPLPSPVKRSRSAQTTGAPLSVDKSAFHTFYSSILGRSEILSPVSRSDLDDLFNVLEGHGLVILSTSVGTSANAKAGRRTLGRSSSFGGTGKQSAPQDVRLGDGVRVEEVLRALRVTEATDDIQEEELREIWDRENKKILKEVKAAELKAQRESGAKFADAAED